MPISLAIYKQFADNRLSIIKNVFFDIVSAYNRNKMTTFAPKKRNTSRFANIFKNKKQFSQ